MSRTSGVRVTETVISMASAGTSIWKRAIVPCSISIAASVGVASLIFSGAGVSAPGSETQTASHPAKNTTGRMPQAWKKGTVPICAKHPTGRSGKWRLSPFPKPAAAGGVSTV